MSMALPVAAQVSGGSGLPFLLMMGVMIGALYFLMFLPQQRRQKKWQQVLEGLKTGDRVVTTGGLKGTVVALKDDVIHLRIPPDNLRLEVIKASVMHVSTAEDESKTK